MRSVSRHSLIYKLKESHNKSLIKWWWKCCSQHFTTTTLPLQHLIANTMEVCTPQLNNMVEGVKIQYRTQIEHNVGMTISEIDHEVGLTLRWIDHKADSPQKSHLFISMKHPNLPPL